MKPRRLKGHLLTPALVAAVLAAWSPGSRACGQPPVPLSAAFSVAPDDRDVIAPGAVTVGDTVVERDRDEGDYQDGCGMGQPGCSPTASIGMQVSVDGDTGDPPLGYIVKPTGGSCMGCDTPIQAEDGWIWVGVFYSPGKTIEAEFQVSAVDRAGNQGPATLAEVTKGAGNGCSQGGSSHGHAQGSLGVVLLLASLALRKSGIR